MITRDTVGPHTHVSKLRDLNPGLSSCRKFATAFKDNLSHLQDRCWMCLNQLIQATGTPNGRNVFPCFYYIAVARFLPLPRFTQMALFSPSWLPVPHYRRDNHHVHDTQETQPPDKLFTHRSQTFEGAQIHHHSSHCDSNKSL